MATRWDKVERLVVEARNGDEEAFRNLLQMHREVVTSTLFACGVRCAETTRVSKGTPRLSSVSAAFFIVSQSDWEPMMIPTRTLSLTLNFLPE